ncbi:MAG: hypothetical protein IIB72_11990 [Proteobacteria bacterium]|nr:hypothetical protein [Pseudomonadota bacterium]
MLKAITTRKFLTLLSLLANPGACSVVPPTQVNYAAHSGTMSRTLHSCTFVIGLWHRFF